MGFFNKLKEGLQKTRRGITERIDQVLVSFGKVDDELFDELEEILITSDLGMDSVMSIMDALRERVKNEKITDAGMIKTVLKEELVNILGEQDTSLDIEPSPAVILVVGVNGVGKTTSIGKIAANLKSQGKRVLLAAGDTFRAAAIDQLQIWADRIGVDMISHSEGSDPAAVIYDAVQAAKARNIDVLICDTAGRLHTKKNLMEELKKVSRVIDREMPNAKKENLLVLDATTGQNAIAQAKQFSEAAPLTGIVLTKLDGTAKGGIVIAIKNELKIPVKLIGVGEGVEDLQPFNAEDFIEALFT